MGLQFQRHPSLIWREKRLSMGVTISRKMLCPFKRVLTDHRPDLRLLEKSSFAAPILTQSPAYASTSDISEVHPWMRDPRSCLSSSVLGVRSRWHPANPSRWSIHRS